MKKLDIEELYWDDWEYSKEQLDEIFDYLRDYNSRTIEELGQTLMLYSNPSGRLTEEFAILIEDIYKNDKIKFIRALNTVKEEAINLVYVFRMRRVFKNEDEDYDEIIKTGKLSLEEIETTDMFFKMYKTICAT